MTNKFVVIINSLKVPKLRKFYYTNWNFLYQITAASRTPDEGAAVPKSPFSLSSVLNWICRKPPPPGTKFLGTPLPHATSADKNVSLCKSHWLRSILRMRHCSFLEGLYLLGKLLVATYRANVWHQFESRLLFKHIEFMLLDHTFRRWPSEELTDWFTIVFETLRSRCT